MIGGGLTRFQPYQQDGKGGLDWKDLKKRAPIIARDVLTGTLTAGDRKSTRLNSSHT